MKEIKFRAYGKHHKKYFEVITINFIRKMVYIETNKKYMHFDDCELEQYTGLKDKNGVEIYEGDKVFIKGDDEEVFEIEWCNDSARFVMDSETLQVDFDNYNGNEVEVIGNIHENKEV